MIKRYSTNSVPPQAPRSFFWAVATVVLWAGVMVSALAVVYSTFEARSAVKELEQLRREESGLRVISGQYLLEKSSWAAYSRVETLARDELGMAAPQAGETVLVRNP